ncbi:MAG: DUF1036 domain-containing protein [Acidobacteriota bacterium]
MKKRDRRKLSASVLLLALVGLLAGAPRLRADDDSSYRGFVNSVAKSLYFLAWPTATYESVEFGDVDFVSSGADVSFRLHGKSAFDDGPLWVDVVIEVRNGDITDLRWGRNNAILAQPGSTIKYMAQELARINSEHPSGQTLSSSSAAGFGYVFTNRCSISVELAIHYMDSSGRWQTEGWWTFAPGETAYLRTEAGRVTSNKATWYFYARTTDNAWEWRGENRFQLNGDPLGMRELTDTEGDSEWYVSCQ